MNIHTISFKQASQWFNIALKLLWKNFFTLLPIGIVFTLLVTASSTAFGLLFAPILSFGLYSAIQMLLTQQKPPLRILFCGFFKIQRAYNNDKGDIVQAKEVSIYIPLMLLGFILALGCFFAANISFHMGDQETLKAYLQKTAELKNITSVDALKSLLAPQFLPALRQYLIYNLLFLLFLTPFFIYSNLFVGWHEQTTLMSIRSSFAMSASNALNLMFNFMMVISFSCFLILLAQILIAMFVNTGLAVFSIPLFLIIFIVVPSIAALLISTIALIAYHECQILPQPTSHDPKNG